MKETKLNTANKADDLMPLNMWVDLNNETDAYQKSQNDEPVLVILRTLPDPVFAIPGPPEENN